MQTKLFMHLEFILSLLFVAVAVAKHIAERLLLSNMHQPITISFHSPFHTSFYSSFWWFHIYTYTHTF